MLINHTGNYVTQPVKQNIRPIGEMPDLPPFLMPQQEDGTKIIEGEFHTLFVSDVDPVLKEFTTTDDGEEFTAIRELVPKHKKYTLYIELFGHQNKQLHKVINELRKSTEHDILEIRIDSPGGYISEGITLYNVMRELFNGRCTTFVDSTAYSMGAMLFSLGDIRVAYEDSSLMYHNYATGAFGKGGEVKSSVEYGDKHFNEFFSKKIVSKGFLTVEEYEDMKKGQDFWFDSYAMAKRGISTHVIVSGFKLDNEAFIEYHDQDLPIDEWAISKILEMTEKAEKEEEEAKAKAEKPKKKRKSPQKKLQKIKQKNK